MYTRRGEQMPSRFEIVRVTNRGDHAGATTPRMFMRTVKEQMPIIPELRCRGGRRGEGLSSGHLSLIFLMLTVIPTLPGCRSATVLPGAATTLPAVAGPGAATTQGSDQLPLLSRWWRPWLVYLRNDPCPSLRVRIDYVAGCAPTQEEIQSAKDFLAAHVDKPGGISVETGPPIAIEAAARQSPESLALLTSIRRSETYAASAAYIHLLFFDSQQTGLSPLWTNHPHVDFLPYPATAYIDLATVRGWARKALPQVIEHELGHILGLVSRRTLHNGGHCDRANCLMAAGLQLHWFRALRGEKQITDQVKLCDQCEADLIADRTGDGQCNTRCFGPIVVRLEDGYFVASLPTVVVLCIGSPDQAFARSLAGQIEKLLSSNSAWHGVGLCAVKDENADGPSVASALDRASRDPYDVVRELATAKQLELRVRSGTASP